MPTAIQITNQELCGVCKRGGLNLLACDDEGEPKDANGQSTIRYVMRCYAKVFNSV